MHHLGVRRLPAWLTRDCRRLCHAQPCIRLGEHHLLACQIVTTMVSAIGHAVPIVSEWEAVPIVSE